MACNCFLQSDEKNENLLPFRFEIHNGINDKCHAVLTDRIGKFMICIHYSQCSILCHKSNKSNITVKKPKGRKQNKALNWSFLLSCQTDLSNCSFSNGEVK